MPTPPSNPRTWREKALRFRTAALDRSDPAEIRRLLRLAEACDRTAAGLVAQDLPARRGRRPWRALRLIVARRRALRRGPLAAA
jgi:hypothetical protein